MKALVDPRGLTLVETLLAASLLFTLAGGAAYVLLLTRQLAVRAEEMGIATTVASARLERIRAIPWQYGIDGSAPEVVALAVSPQDALERDVDGLHELLDASGRPVRRGIADPRFVCRWAIVPVAADSGDARGIEACVFVWPAGEDALPVVCLASARGRQP